jgi:diguanylate cyclase (GGDEF)-like protein
LKVLEKLLSPEFDVFTAPDAHAAEALFAQRPVDIILTDQKMPRRTGVQLLEWVHQHHPHTISLLMTGYEELADTIEAINRGHVYYYVSKPWGTQPETLLVALRNAAKKFELERSREHLVEDLRRSNRELEEANRRLVQHTRDLERAALTDSLTGLWNRRYIEELAAFEVRRRFRYPSPLSIGLLQVERIDPAAGDEFQTEVEECLEELSGILACSLREFDSVGRLHGEKFMIVARETGAEGAARLSERIQAQIAATPFKHKGQRIAIALGIGFAVAEAGVPASYEAMFGLAAAALGAARTAGRNRCEVRRLSLPAS